MKKTLYILAILAVSIFTACSDDDKKSIEYTMTVASAQRVMFIADHFSPYYVKHQGQNEWKEHAYIKDFSHQEIMTKAWREWTVALYTAIISWKKYQKPQKTLKIFLSKQAGLT